MIKRNNIFVVITIIANIYAQNYENEFIQVWQDLPWGNGGYFPASSILSMTGPFDADGDEQQEFLITSSWTGAIGNDMGVYEVAGDDSLVLIWYADLMDYGINQASNVSKAEIGDLDNDGDIDIVVSNLNDHPVILWNVTEHTSNWFILKLIGTSDNQSAIGTRVKITIDQQIQVREVKSGSGYLSQSDLRLHFGLGQAKQIDQLEIRWSNGTTKQFNQVPGNQTLTVTQNEPPR